MSNKKKGIKCVCFRHLIGYYPTTTLQPLTINYQILKSPMWISRANSNIPSFFAPSFCYNFWPRSTLWPGNIVQLVIWDLLHICSTCNFMLSYNVSSCTFGSIFYLVNVKKTSLHLLCFCFSVNARFIFFINIIKEVSCCGLRRLLPLVSSWGRQRTDDDRS